NLAYDATQDTNPTPDRAPGEFYTAVVDMKNFLRFLQSYHVAPRNIVCCIIEHHALVFYVYIGSAGYGVGALNDQTCGSLTYYIPFNAPMRGAFSPMDAAGQQQQQQQQFAYNYAAPQQHQQQQFQQGQPGQTHAGDPYGMFAQGLQSNHAAQLGMQFAGSAMHAMQENVQQNVGRVVSMSQLKHHFDVSNMYVLSKLRMVAFPWLQRSWHRQAERDQTGQVVGYKTPREDSNSPDLYIPVMGLVSYVIAVGLVMGRMGVFHPEDLGFTASSALGIVIFEVLLVKMFCYLLNVGAELQFPDIVAYSGYKFVPTI
ncbi:Transport protein yif1, partial [Coemansia nantahalensis]